MSFDHLEPILTPPPSIYFCFKILFHIGVWKSDSVIGIYVSILFQVLFPFRVLQNIEERSLTYTVDPC